MLMNDLNRKSQNQDIPSSGKEGDINKQLDLLLKKLLDSKKVSKQQLIQKLMSVGGDERLASQGSTRQGKSVKSNQQSIHQKKVDTDAMAHQSSVNGNENILEDASEDSGSRVPIDASHRNAVSSTNNGFYKFRSQDNFHQLQHHDRPKSSKGGARNHHKTSTTNH